jgi:general secretion pathway protein G
MLVPADNGSRRCPSGGLAAFFHPIMFRFPVQMVGGLPIAHADGRLGSEGSPNPPLGQRRPPRRASRSGFTLMEMIIVLSIIALLMGMVIMKMSGFGEIAKLKKVQADLIALKEGLSAYELQTGTLPTTDQGLKALWEKPTQDPVPDQWHKVMDEEVMDPWNHSYQYQNPGKHNTDGYDIWSNGDGSGKQIGNWKDTSSSS